MSSGTSMHTSSYVSAQQLPQLYYLQREQMQSSFPTSRTVTAQKDVRTTAIAMSAPPLTPTSTFTIGNEGNPRLIVRPLTTPEQPRKMAVTEIVLECMDEKLEDNSFEEEDKKTNEWQENGTLYLQKTCEPIQAEKNIESYDVLSNGLQFDEQHKLNSPVSAIRHRLDLDLVQMAINDLKAKHLRTDKPRIICKLQKLCSLSKERIEAFLNGALLQKSLEKVQCRDYFALRVRNASGQGSSSRSESLIGTQSELAQKLFLVNEVAGLMRETNADQSTPISSHTLLEALHVRKPNLEVDEQRLKSLLEEYSQNAKGD